MDAVAASPKTGIQGLEITGCLKGCVYSYYRSGAESSLVDGLK